MDYLPIFIRLDEIKEFPSEADHILQAAGCKSVLVKVRGYCCDQITARITAEDQGPAGGFATRFLHDVTLQFEGYHDDFLDINERIYDNEGHEPKYIVLFPTEDGKFWQIIDAQLGYITEVRKSISPFDYDHTLCHYSFKYKFPTLPNFPADVTLDKVTAMELLDYLYKS